LAWVHGTVAGRDWLESEARPLPGWFSDAGGQNATNIPSRNPSHGGLGSGLQLRTNGRPDGGDHAGSTLLGASPGNARTWASDRGTAPGSGAAGLLERGDLLKVPCRLQGVHWDGGLTTGLLRASDWGHVPSRARLQNHGAYGGTGTSTAGTQAFPGRWADRGLAAVEVWVLARRTGALLQEAPDASTAKPRREQELRERPRRLYVQLRDQTARRYSPGRHGACELRRQNLLPDVDLPARAPLSFRCRNPKPGASWT